MTHPASHDKIRVLAVGQTPPPVHGQGVMMERLVNAKMERAEIVHVRMEFSKTNDAVGRFQLGKLFELASVILRVWWARLRNRIDIFYYPPAGPNRIPIYRDIIILLCCRWMFPKTVFHMQASGGSEYYDQMNALGRYLFRIAYHEPEAVVRLSEFTIDDAKNYKAKREFIVPNCADDVMSDYPNASESRESLEILYVGTVCETKGILDLLESCRLLAARQVHFRLHVVGDFQPDSFGEVVRDKVLSYELGDSVILHGQLTGDAKFQRFSEADVFCFPTYYASEAFPCVVVEAMSFQLPVVATRWRGIQSIVEHEETGLLVDPRDTKSLADALERLSKDKSIRKCWSENGRQSFVANFTTEKHIQTMERVFLDVVGQTQARQASADFVAAS